MQPTVGHVAAAVPPSSHSRADTLDAAAVQFLMAQTLMQRQREEEGGGTEVGEGRRRRAKEKGGAEGEVRGKDVGGQPSRPRRYRHAC